MSSNITVQRVCEYCGKEFTARTTSTRYCSHKCNSRHYKQKQKLKKIESSNKETTRIKKQSIEELKAKEFLTVTQVSKLIGCSRQNVYKLINSGKLDASNILEKKTIVRRSDLDSFFEKNKLKQAEKKRLLDFSIEDCYTITEAQNKFGISDSALNNIIKRHNIPKIKKGWYSYVPKQIIDELLT